MPQLTAGRWAEERSDEVGQRSLHKQG